MNKVAIIYSPGFGAGWSTWGENAQALDQELAAAIEVGNKKDIRRIAEKNWPDAYDGGLSDCIVTWVDYGTPFLIEEYDGSESIKFTVDFTLAKPHE
jgi:hypothetical protein